MRRRLLVVAVALLGGGLTAASFFLFFDHQKSGDETAAQRDLVAYFESTFPKLHAETRSIQGGLAQLVEGKEGGLKPSPETAAEILEENILPSIDYQIERARKTPVSGEVAGELHRGYVEVLEAMREDAGEMEVIFEGDGDAGEKRARAREMVVEIADRFSAWNERVTRTWAEHGISVQASDAGLAAPDA